MHYSWGRGYAPPTSERTSVALQHSRQRPSVLFYHLRVDMWNWQASALASGASLVLYDGYAFGPTPSILFDYADAVGMTLFGTSAKYIESLRKENLSPRQAHSLATLKTMTSTGSPLSHEGFEYVYEHIKEDIALASISGSTEIISCFVLGNPIGPVYSGEIQTPGLGMTVQVFDLHGNPVRQQKGELVCVKPFPSMTPTIPSTSRPILAISPKSLFGIMGTLLRSPPKGASSFMDDLTRSLTRAVCALARPRFTGR